MTPTSESTRMTSQQWIDLGLQYGAPVLWSCVILLAAFFASSFVRRLVLNACARAEIDQTPSRFFAKFAQWAILLLASTFVLNKFGFETASFSVLIGAVGLAISLAFQGTLSNFASGIMLMIFRPYKIGDSIIAAGQSGSVYEIDLFSTTLDTADNKRIFIPNTAIFGAVITNMSFHERRRVDVLVVLHHSADIDKTRALLIEAATGVPGRLADQPEVVLAEMTAAGITWQIHVWSQSGDFIAVRQATLREIKVALDKAGIAFAVSVSPTNASAVETKR